MCGTKGDPDERVKRVIELSMVDTLGGTTHAVSIDQDASVEDLVGASAAALGVSKGGMRMTFSDTSPDRSSSLHAIGMRDGAVYEIARYPVPPPPAPPAPPESPESPARPVRAFDWARLIAGVAALACLMVPFVILGLSVYGLIDYNTTGCRQPVCTAGGVLQCCTVDEFYGVCDPRPDLQGLSCAAWQRADRACQQYRCRYTKGAEVRYKDADDDTFEELPRSTKVMCEVGITVGAFLVLSMFWNACVRPTVD